MRNNVVALLALAAAGSIGGSACAMNQPAAQRPQCVVSGADKLPAEVGGADAICAAIVSATRQQAPATEFSVEVRVLTPSSLAAVVTLADGRSLPEQKMAISDRQLGRGSVERFASTVASEIARASRR